MSSDQTLASTGRAELVLKIGSDTKIFTEIEADSAPVVCIQAAEWQVLFYPFSDAEGLPPDAAEAHRASEIVMAFARWRNAIAEKATADHGLAVECAIDALEMPGEAPGDEAVAGVPVEGGERA